MDVDSIALGRDFRDVLSERLSACDLMLVLIGKGWIDARDNAGHRRLDKPDDFVRQEVATALQRNIPVTPLLLQGAAMPVPEQLPEDLKNLAFRNAFELSYTRWKSDLAEMKKRLDLSGPMPHILPTEVAPKPARNRKYINFPYFLQDGKSHSVLAWISIGIAMLAVVVWSVIIYILPENWSKNDERQTAVCAQQGVAAGGNINGSTIILSQKDNGSSVGPCIFGDKN